MRPTVRFAANYGRPQTGAEASIQMIAHPGLMQSAPEPAVGETAAQVAASTAPTNSPPPTLPPPPADFASDLERAFRNLSCLEEANTVLRQRVYALEQRVLELEHLV